MFGSPDFHPHRYSARWPVVARQRGSFRALASFQSTTTPTLRRRILLLAWRLRRFFNAWVAAAIAHHAHQAASAAQQSDRLQLDRIYRGPIDQLLANWRRSEAAPPRTSLQNSIAKQHPTEIQGD
jgi:heme-degrading monooxygenase HmoA